MSSKHKKAAFTSGSWIGTLKVKGEECEILLEMQFENLSVTGNGFHKIVGNLDLEGKYQEESPFEVTFSIRGRNMKLEFQGYREKSHGGLFGSVTGDSGGTLHIRPSQTSNQTIQEFEKNALKKQLQDMGFDQQTIEEASSKCSTIVEAMDWISRHTFNSQSSSQYSSNVNNDDLIQQIVDLGFSKEQAAMALEIMNNNLDQAVNFLLENQ